MLAEVAIERRAKTERRLGTKRNAERSLPAVVPQAPRTLEETGLPMPFLIELVSKILFVHGQLKLAELAAHIKLNVSVLDALIAFLHGEKLCEVTRRGSSGTDADLSYRLTELGHIRAAEFQKHNAYAGPAPVPLSAYCAQVEAQSLAHMRILRADVMQQLGDIVVDPAVLDQLGSAMNSRRPIFIHGQAGSGKTFLAERLCKLLKGDIAVPHAIMVGGEVVQIHDPVVHRPAATIGSASGSIAKHDRHDARWMLCMRPATLAGSELTLDMLDLQFDPAKRYYQAPPHLKANNGIFIIDDLGRQRCSPSELMNRWLMPMERQVDYLSLHTGYRFPVPFDVIVVFSSCMLPEQLADEAFLRRLGNKIHLGVLTPAQYESIFRQVCEQYDIRWCSDAFHYLLHERHYNEGRPLLACHPRDILARMREVALYEGRPCQLDRQGLDQAWNSCFTGP
jgi:predicted ATPase with chaperone activity